jgi:CRP-like cAMP-binding protein
MDITTLVQAVHKLGADEAFGATLGEPQWEVLARYLVRRKLRAGESLIRQGDPAGRCAYLLERGTLQMFTSGAATGSQRITILRPGSIVGEPGLFVAQPRGANVAALTPAVVWALDAERVDELCADEPELALHVLRAAGAVMARRARANAEHGLPQT